MAFKKTKLKPKFLNGTYQQCRVLLYAEHSMAVIIPSPYITNGNVLQRNSPRAGVWLWPCVGRGPVSMCILGILFSTPTYFIILFWDKVSSLNLKITILADWLASGALRFACFHGQGLGHRLYPVGLWAGDLNSGPQAVQQGLDCWATSPGP